jgi:hypothetical protein
MRAIHPVMKFFKIFLLPALSMMISGSTFAKEQPKPEELPKGQNLYVIEREIPGAGDLTAEQLKEISQKSCGVLDNLGSEISWIHSYVTGDKIYCVYTAPNEEMVRDHAKRGGFPANSVSRVSAIISPKTAE